MELLLKHLAREISVLEIHVPMLIPRLRLISRDVIPKVVDETCVQWFAVGEDPVRVWHRVYIFCYRHLWGNSQFVQPLE